MKIRIERYLIRTADRTPAVLIDYHRHVITATKKFLHLPNNLAEDFEIAVDCYVNRGILVTVKRT
jgi:hypothetical protein